MGYLVDSNVLIDYVAERFTQDRLDILDAIFDESLKVSVITKIEILGYNGLTDEETRMVEFLNYADVISLDDTIVDKTISLKKSIKIKTPDAIIASTALTLNLTLITNNATDFKKIPGLNLFDPYQG